MCLDKIIEKVLNILEDCLEEDFSYQISMNSDNLTIKQNRFITIPYEVSNGWSVQEALENRVIITVDEYTDWGCNLIKNDRTYTYCIQSLSDNNEEILKELEEYQQSQENSEDHLSIYGIHRILEKYEK